MPRFFINRPIFAWVIAIMITLAGLLFRQDPAGFPVPAHRASADYHQCSLSGRLGADGSRHGHPGGGTETQRPRQPDLHVVQQRLLGGGVHQPDLQGGH